MKVEPCRDAEDLDLPLRRCGHRYFVRIVLVLALALVASACGNADAGLAATDSPLGMWVVVELADDGADIELDDEIAVDVVGDAVTGGSGCQGFSADIEWDDDGMVAISESYVVTLRPGCPQDDPLLRAFFDAEMWSVSDAGDLLLEGPATMLTLAPVGPGA